MTTSLVRILDIDFTLRHWNQNAACFIPSGWVAIVEADMGFGLERFPKIYGSSPADLIATLKRDFSRVVAPQHIHDLVAKHQHAKAI